MSEYFYYLLLFICGVNSLASLAEGIIGVCIASLNSGLFKTLYSSSK
jgi:hypothetical protein